MDEITTKKVVPIMITGEDAKVFLAFTANREKFLILLKAGVFDLDFGRAEINVHNGQVQNVHIDRMTYKREKLSTP